MNTQRIRTVITGLVATAMVIYHLVSTQYLLVDTVQHDNIHIGFCLVLVFLTLLGKSRWYSLIALVGITLTLVATGYRHIVSTELEALQGYITNTSQIAVAIILLLAVFEATRKTWGWVIFGIGVVFAGYLFLYGNMPWEYVLGRLSLADSGLYSFVLRTSSTFIFLFILFGMLLDTCGAMPFFTEASKLLQGRFAAGAALSVVGTGALAGTVSASPGANAPLLGSFGIPLMKKAGYTPEEAAGVTASASIIGFLMPPILGSVVFVMVSWTGIPYIRIVGASCIPALLLTFGLILYCHFQAKKKGISSVTAKVDVRELLLRSPLFLIPLCILVFLLFKSYPLPFTIFWTILPLMALSFMRKATRLGLKQWVQGFTVAATLGAQIGVLCSFLGVIPLMLGVTGLSIKLPQLLLTLGGQNQFILLILTAVIAIILGCGVPVIAVYVMLAMVATPPLIQLGFSAMQAHFFIFYYATLSFITPPIAPSVFVTAIMAKAKTMRAGVEAVKSSAGAFFAPLFFITFPGLLLLPSNPSFTLLGLGLALIFIIMFEAAQCNYMLTSLNRIERIVFFIGCGLIMVYLYDTAFYALAIIGAALFFPILAWQIIRRRNSAINIS